MEPKALVQSTFRCWLRFSKSFEFSISFGVLVVYWDSISGNRCWFLPSEWEALIRSECYFGIWFSDERRRTLPQQLNHFQRVSRWHFIWISIEIRDLKWLFGGFWAFWTSEIGPKNANIENEIWISIEIETNTRNTIELNEFHRIQRTRNTNRIKRNEHSHKAIHFHFEFQFEIIRNKSQLRFAKELQLKTERSDVIGLKCFASLVLRGLLSFC